MPGDSAPGLVDGVIVLASIWGTPTYYMVKGYTHTDGYITALTYRLPNCAKPTNPARLVYHPCLGSRVPALSRDKVLYKVQAGRQASLPPRIRGFLEEFSSLLGLEQAWVTGSHAIGCEGPSSDVDIIAPYNPEAPRALRDLAEEGLISQCQAERVLSKRATQGPGGVALDKARIGSSLLDSCYKGVPYTLRLLTSLWEEPCRDPLVPLGRARLLVEVQGGSPYTVPARYEALVVKALMWKWGRVPRRVWVESWRTRYQELAPGAYIIEGLARLGARSGRYTLWPDYGWIRFAGRA